jgi:hypothetical protein
VKSILLIECKIPSLKLAIEFLPDTFDFEEHLIHLENPNDQFQDASMTIEVNNQCDKVQYDRYVCPEKYVEGELVLLYDQAKEQLGAGNFNPM